MSGRVIGWNDYFFGLIIGATLLLSVLGLKQSKAFMRF